MTPSPQDPLIARAMRSPAAGVALIVLALATLGHGACLWSYDGVCDDAYITFRHSLNLTLGHGPVFNPGERVEGYTTPSWMLLMAGAIALGLDPVPVSKALGVAAAAALLLVLYRSLRRAGAPPGGAGLGALLLSASPIVHEWSVSGMESCAYALLLFLGVERLARRDATVRDAGWASLALAAAALTHPEALAFWALGGAGVFLAGGGGRWRRAAVYLAPGLLLLGHFIWRFAYYGDWLPNTYYAKTGAGSAAWPVGFRELDRFVTDPGQLTWLIVAAVGGVMAWEREDRRCVTIMAATVVAQMLYAVSIGGDHMYIFRLHLPLLAPLAFLAGLLFVPAPAAPGSRWPRQLIATAALAATTAATFSLGQFRYRPAFEELVRYYEGNEKLGRHLAATQSRDTVIAVQAAGAIPYHSGLHTLDMFGLNDRHIARLPFPDIVRGGLLKWDNAYILALKPGMIVINRGYFPVDDPRAERGLAGVPAMTRHLIDVDLFARLEGEPEYRLQAIDLGDGSRFFVAKRD